MSMEGRPNQNEGSALESETHRLEANLDELAQNLKELEGSDPSRIEKVRDFIIEHATPLTLTLVGLAGGTHDLVYEGSVGGFLLKTGLGVLVAALAEYQQGKYRGKIDAIKNGAVGLEKGEE